VVVPALNEGAHLHRTIEGLQATLPGESEIIVIDDDWYFSRFGEIA
jgi:glycosyltransferase involved in cell wall biosynthesis